MQDSVASGISRRSFIASAVAAVAGLGLVGLSANGTMAFAENKSIDKLSIAFVPSREPQEIITATDPLKDLLKKELANVGYDVNTVDITVGTSYEAVGEALSAGTTDLGFIPGGTYVLYDDGCDPLLTATRDGLSIDSDKAKDWNDNKPTKPVEQQVTSYRALIIAGPSAKGKELVDKIQSGADLSWDDVAGANWAVMGSSSPAGYIYPSLWLKKTYDKMITDLPHAVQCDSYGSAFARLASGQVDVLCTYADARRDYESKWNDEYAMSGSIWDDTGVIGVTPAIYNDTISASKSSKVLDDDFKKAITQAFITIGSTEEGKKIISIYGHNGYVEAHAEDYDFEREAQQMLKDMSSIDNLQDKKALDSTASAAADSAKNE